MLETRYRFTYFKPPAFLTILASIPLISLRNSNFYKYWFHHYAGSSRQLFCSTIILKILKLAGIAVTKCNFIETKMVPERHIGFNDLFKGKFSAVQGCLVTFNEKESEKEMN